MSWLQTILGQWRLLLAALVAAGIVHIITTLTAAESDSSRGIARLSRDLPANQVVFLPPVTTNAQPLPFLSPDARYALCSFDASASLIRLRATLPESGWSLSLHAPDGGNFYFVPGIDGRETNVELMLRPPGGRFLANTVEIVRGGQVIPEVQLAYTQGLAILKAPIKGLAYRRLADEQLGTFECGPIHPTTTLNVRTAKLPASRVCSSHFPPHGSWRHHRHLLRRHRLPSVRILRLEK